MKFFEEGERIVVTIKTEPQLPTQVLYLFCPKKIYEFVQDFV